MTKNFELKLRILRDADLQAAHDAVLVTNTLSIPISRLAAVPGRPDRPIGMHSSDPVAITTLLELIRSLQTADTTDVFSLAFAVKIGKAAMTMRNSRGFADNRIMVPTISGKR